MSASCSRCRCACACPLSRSKPGKVGRRGVTDRVISASRRRSRRRRRRWLESRLEPDLNLAWLLAISLRTSVFSWRFAFARGRRRRCLFFSAHTLGTLLLSLSPVFVCVAFCVASACSCACPCPCARVSQSEGFQDAAALSVRSAANRNGG